MHQWRNIFLSLSLAISVCLSVCLSVRPSFTLTLTLTCTYFFLSPTLCMYVNVHTVKKVSVNRDQMPSVNIKATRR